MDTVRNGWCNFTYLGPTPDIFDLPCRRETDESGEQTEVLSFWKPTPAELEQLQAGATIVLGIHTPVAIPPVSLGVQFTPDDLPLLIGLVPGKPRLRTRIWGWLRLRHIVREGRLPDGTAAR